MEPQHTHEPSLRLRKPRIARKTENHISIEHLKRLFVCNPINGTLTWRKRPDGNCYRTATWNKRFAGQIAGRLNTQGYIQIVITFNSVRYHTMAHRVIWAMAKEEWLDPSLDLDHENNIHTDNRLVNLRPATETQNSCNKVMQKNNTSGYKGVYWYPRGNKWNALITVNKQKVELGHFSNPIDAAKAYDRSAIKYFGEFARTNLALGRYAQ